MIILGIDPALTNCGWGIIKKANVNELSFISAGTIKTSSSSKFSDRILKIHDQLEKVIKLYKPNEISIEETFINVNSKTSMVLSQARGAIMLSLAQSGKEISEYSATNIKKTIVGRGRAEKQQVQMMVNILLPKIDIKIDEHAADALACAITHANYTQFSVS